MALGQNVYERQAANRRGTVLVMAAFILFVALLGLGFDAFVLGSLPIEDEEGMGIPLPIGTLVAAGMGTVGAFRGLHSGHLAVLRSAGAEPLDPADTGTRQLSNITEEMAIAAGLPCPQVYLIPDPDPNAFATGPDPQHASIAVTRGLVERLDRDELQAVVAHEMGHIRNLDTRLMTVVAALIGTVMLISEYGVRIMRFGGGGSKRKGRSGGGGGILGAVVLILWLVAVVLAPLVSNILAMAVSRQREYLADASAAELTRNPSALASALEKIDGAADPTRAIKKGSAHLCIADPLGRQVNEREGTFADLFATHPPIRKRITLLRAMAYQHA
jgi:heat shock protein HtpX